MGEHNCPECGERLEAVRFNPDCLLNFEQWSSIRAGDYFCRRCRGDRGKSGYRYYWKSELD
jgi:hypothetical protein